MYLQLNAPSSKNNWSLNLSLEIKVHDLTSVFIPYLKWLKLFQFLPQHRCLLHVNTFILKFTLLWTEVKLFWEKVQTIFSSFLCSGGDSGNLQSARQQRRKLIWSSSISGGQISPLCRLLSSIWSTKPDSSTAAPLGLNIHMFCEMLEMVQVWNPQRRSGSLWRYSRLVHVAWLLGMRSRQSGVKEASF